MIDSHCHLDQEPLFKNIHEVLKRSKKIGLSKLLTICTTLESFKKIKKLVELDEIIYGTFGIHPHESKNDFVDKELIIKKVKENRKIIGVGETGLDFFYNNSDKEIQKTSFVSHIEAAIDLNLPLIIHSRNAEKDTFNILNEFKNKNIKILMHCFTGSLSLAKKLLELDSFFSASGIVTFKNSNDLQKTFDYIPLEKILVETDSPYLAPVPMRGKKNEPSYIKYTIEKIAEIKKIKIDYASKITSQNFNKLFNLI